MSVSNSRPRIYAAIVLLLAMTFILGGTRLVLLGGSMYYLITGAALLASGILLWRGNRNGALLYGLTLLATLIWSFAEVGLDLWALMPRLLMLSILGLWLLMPWTRRKLYGADASLKRSRGSLMLLVIGVAVVVAGIIKASSISVAPLSATHSHTTLTLTTHTSQAATDWPTYGNSASGTRYAQLEQINTGNVGKLKEIWRVRTGVQGAFKATPIQVGKLLYMCAGANVLIALDADSGKLIWRHDPKVNAPHVGAFGTTCRGVTYYRASENYSGDCPQRILTGTTDTRLIAVDALSGESCQSFGNRGEVNLLEHMGEVKPGFNFVTSPPTIAGNVAVVGGWVIDNVEVGEPSGVVRAFDALTGKFVWAWDLGRPGVNTEPKEGEQYTRGTPNAWSIFSYDPKLNLVYLPTGNTTPDYFGANRSRESEQYSSSVVALDASNGAVRWSFQTVHHDIWDYDVPSQPVLFDFTQADGSVVPALVQATKRGELFLLDRRNGKPLTEVKELPVPQGAAPGDWTAKTQPFSVGMPNFRAELHEANMWGLTPLDQLWCRIEFRKLRYEGHFTPPMVGGSLQFPGNAGGFNWGSVAVDEDHQLLIVDPLIMANRVELYPRDKIPTGLRVASQTGTPYAMTTQPFMSPLSVPCQQPPYGKLAAIDLHTQKILWSKPLGLANASGPFGLSSHLRLPMGAPLTAGTMVTQGGLIFVSGSMDRFFRAVDEKTGEELWRDYLPGTAQATPMTYLGPTSQKQIVVITVPNAQRGFGPPTPGKKPPPEDPQGGYVIAYALNK